MKPYYLPIFCCLLPIPAQGQEGLETHKQQYSYTVGAQFAQSIKQQPGLNLDVAAFTRGIADILNGAELKLTVEQMRSVVNLERQKAEQLMQEIAARNKKLGDEFLAENREREEVTITGSGLQYEILNAGEGDKPAADDTVVVHYRATLVNGREFDNSYKRKTPATLSLTGLMPGWREGLQLMAVGSKWKLFIPENLAYGERGAGDRIGPGETLIFEVELLEIK